MQFCRSDLQKIIMAEKELLEYLMVRHVSVDPRPTDLKQVPPKIYKSWKRRWVVLSSEVSPAHCFVHYCKTEGDWLLKSSSLVKCPLDDFKLARVEVKGYSNVLQLSFPHYCLEIAFDSLTKIEQWFNMLQPIIDRYHVDLVRCPQYPTREGEYIMEILHNSFKLWTTVPKPHTALCWEWQLKYLRRVHFHRTVSKLEVESGRNTETGEGHFFFTGWHIKRLFETMKEMMTRGARVLPGPEPSRRDLGYFLTKTPVNSQLLLNGSNLSVNTTNSCPPLTPRDLVQADSDSEDDSTSTDSGNSSGVGGVGGVFNYAPGNTQTSRSLPASSAFSSPPPLPPRDRVVRKGSTNPHFRQQYMDINPATRTPSDDYVTIRRQPGYYRDPRSIHVAESNPHHEAVAGRSGEADSSSEDGEQPREEPDTSHYSVPRRARNFGLPPIPPARKTSSLSTAGQ